MKAALVLVIDDDSDMRWAMRRILTESGFEVTEADGGSAGLASASYRSPDAVLLDMRMPGIGGDGVMQGLKIIDKSISVIVVTAFGTIPGAIDAIRTGAFEYITKPFRNEQLLETVHRAVALCRIKRGAPASSVRAQITATMGRGPAIQALADQIEAVISTDYSVLICGETGTGKELVAHCLHDKGPRAKQPLAIVDCGALTDSLIDSEFFGHEKGAFTGAVDRRSGRLEMAARGGTVFLDEVGNLSLAGQKALLRALEERVIHRVGGIVPIALDMRVMAATNENLAEGAVPGTFREDLFFRLAEYVITVPPLRERLEDVEFLANRFLIQAREDLARPPMKIAADALDLLRRRRWPGNVRELRNVMRRLALIGSDVLKAQDIASGLKERGHHAAVVPYDTGDPVALRAIVRTKVREVEHEAVLNALAQAGGNKSQAARDLGIDYKTYRLKLKLASSRPEKLDAH